MTLDRSILRHLAERGLGRWTVTAEMIDAVRADVEGSSHDEVLRRISHLASRHTHRHPLIIASGSLDTPAGSAASSRHTAVSISPLGRAMNAACAETDSFPLELVVGNFHDGGTVPTFPIDRMVACLSIAAAGGWHSSSEATAFRELGPPVFASGCGVQGSIDAPLSGRGRSRLTLTSHIAEATLATGVAGHDVSGLDVSALPSWWLVESALDIALPAPARWINLSSGQDMRLFVAVDDSDAPALREHLQGVWPLAIDLDVDFSGPWLQPWQEWFDMAPNPEGTLANLLAAVDEPVKSPAAAGWSQ